MSARDYSLQMDAAQESARLAGAFLRKAFHSDKTVDGVYAHDIKLRLDKESQELITSHLHSRFPDYAVLGEEGDSGSGDIRWIVDPIDGTVNYFYGIPVFCVSIALEVRGELVLGCVYDPMQDEMFSAVAGGTPMLNGRPIRVSDRAAMGEAVIFVGHGTHDGSGGAGLKRFAHLSAQVRKIRILGSAALTLCYIAAGRFDAYIENRINVWDFAAARVILEAAGGVFQFEAHDAAGVTGAVVAWNGKLPLLQAMQTD